MAYRFHISKPVSDARLIIEVEWGRTSTLCGTNYPQKYVFDTPVEGQPMCKKCMKQWANATSKRGTV